jgi:putative transposase
VLTWEMSNQIAVDFCLSALDASWAYGTPEIFNSDQGSQFTSAHFVGALG